jgi:hypothetical protein
MKLNKKDPVENVLTRMTKEVLKSYEYGYQVDKVILTIDMYEEFKKLMTSKNTALGVLHFIDNKEYWNDINVIIDEDEWNFDSVIIQAVTRIPDGYKSDLELELLESEDDTEDINMTLENNKLELLESEGIKWSGEDE